MKRNKFFTQIVNVFHLLILYYGNIVASVISNSFFNNLRLAISLPRSLTIEETHFPLL